MSKIEWDQEGQRFYETGVSNGVLYVRDTAGYKTGVPWNGLINVSESPSGAEANPIYADNIKYLSLTSAEDFAATIEAYTYPDEFAECDGSAELAEGFFIGQQVRKSFAFAYKTKIGNDVDDNLGYKLHVVYGAKAAPSEKAYGTINESPEAITFSWEVSTVPVPVEGYKPTSTIVLDSTKVEPAKLAAVEEKLFGSDAEEPKLLLPNEILALLQ